MGNTESIEIPGGGTDGYHVLRVCIFIYNFFLIINRIRVHFRYKTTLLVVKLDCNRFLISL